MSQLAKLVERARTSPRNLRYSELVRILSGIGEYEFHNQVGSHCTCSKKGHYPITLTRTPGLAKVEEVKKVVTRLEEE